MKSREIVLNAFKSVIFPLPPPKGTVRVSDLIAPIVKVSDRTRLKILTPKKILQRSP